MSIAELPEHDPSQFSDEEVGSLFSSNPDLGIDDPMDENDLGYISDVNKVISALYNEITFPYTNGDLVRAAWNMHYVHRAGRSIAITSTHEIWQKACTEVQTSLNESPEPRKLQIEGRNPFIILGNIFEVPKEQFENQVVISLVNGYLGIFDTTQHEDPTIFQANPLPVSVNSSKDSIASLERLLLFTTGCFKGLTKVTDIYTCNDAELSMMVDVLSKSTHLAMKNASFVERNRAEVIKRLRNLS